MPKGTLDSWVREKGHLLLRAFKKNSYPSRTLYQISRLQFIGLYGEEPKLSACAARCATVELEGKKEIKQQEKMNISRLSPEKGFTLQKCPQARKHPPLSY